MSTLIYTLSEAKGGGFTSDPESASATEANTTLLYQLDAQAAEDYRLTGFVATDRLNQLGEPVISADGCSMTVNDVNNQAETINVNVTVEHRKTAAQHFIDPMVINAPPV